MKQAPGLKHGQIFAVLSLIFGALYSVAQILVILKWIPVLLLIGALWMITFPWSMIPVILLKTSAGQKRDKPAKLRNAPTITLAKRIRPGQHN